MPVAGTTRISARPNAKPLLVALAVSLAAHVFFFVLLVTFGIAAALHNIEVQKALARMKRTEVARAKTAASQEAPLLFVEVNPDQVATEAPKKPKFYSSQNSQAANTDPQIETDAPKLDGSQTHVPKTETVTKSKAMPLQPSAPKNPDPEEQQAEAKPKSSPKVGDLAMAHPVQKPAENKTESPETPVVGHQRPRTLAEARQQMGLIGEKMKQDGGVQKQRLVPSFDAVGTPFGDYDARIIAAVQQRWYDLLDNRSISRDRTGRVVVEFRLGYDGRVTDEKVVESDVGDLLSYLCMAAIKDPSPYDRWPAEMRRVMEGDSRLVRFTFFYE